MHHLLTEGSIPVDVVLENEGGVEVGLQDVFDQVEMGEPRDAGTVGRMLGLRRPDGLICINQVRIDGGLCRDLNLEAD